MGEMKCPSISPNLIHFSFKGFSNEGFVRDINNNIVAMNNDHSLIGFDVNNGHKAIIKKIIKNKKPNFFSEEIFINSNIYISLIYYTKIYVKKSQLHNNFKHNLTNFD